MPSNLMRVQKFLAHQGVASRRTIEKMINAGRITINGIVVTQQGVKVDPVNDTVTVDGLPIKTSAEYIYLWINKPVGIISAATSKYGETTVVDLVDVTTRVYPVGRLDKDSQGLLLLTNDGELTHRLTHPRYHFNKTYTVTVSGNVTDKKLARLRNGIQLEEGMTAPAQVEVLNQTNGKTTMQFVIHEGRNRQIRRMCAVVDLLVVDLIRTAFGPIDLADLAVGESRFASFKEVEELKSLVGLPASTCSTST